MIEMLHGFMVFLVILGITVIAYISYIVFCEEEQEDYFEGRQYGNKKKK